MKWILVSASAMLLRRRADRHSRGTEADGFRTIMLPGVEETIESCVQEDKEFCPFDKSCKPKKDCSTCRGHYRLNAIGRTCEKPTMCEKPLLPFLKNMCGEEPSGGCCAFSLGLLGCHDACAVQFQMQSYGPCATSTAAGCPPPICENICGCSEAGSECPPECFGPCDKYRKNLFANVFTGAPTQADFVDRFEQCIFGKDPKNSFNKASCA